MDSYYKMRQLFYQVRSIYELRQYLKRRIKYKMSGILTVLLILFSKFSYQQEETKPFYK